MDPVDEFLTVLRGRQMVSGYFAGMLHLLIGRTLVKADGSVVSTGLTWRAMADVLKTLRFDRELVRELGLDPDDLPPRDREKFWFAAILRAGITSPRIKANADALSVLLPNLGYRIQ